MKMSDLEFLLVKKRVEISVNGDALLAFQGLSEVSWKFSEVKRSTEKMPTTDI